MSHELYPLPENIVTRHLQKTGVDLSDKLFILQPSVSTNMETVSLFCKVCQRDPAWTYTSLGNIAAGTLPCYCSKKTQYRGIFEDACAGHLYKTGFSFPYEDPNGDFENVLQKKEWYCPVCKRDKKYCATTFSKLSKGQLTCFCSPAPRYFSPTDWNGCHTFRNPDSTVSMLLDQDFNGVLNLHWFNDSSCNCQPYRTYPHDVMTGHTPRCVHCPKKGKPYDSTKPTGENYAFCQLVRIDGDVYLTTKIGLTQVQNRYPRSFHDDRAPIINSSVCQSAHGFTGASIAKSFERILHSGCDAVRLPRVEGYTPTGSAGEKEVFLGNPLNLEIPNMEHYPVHVPSNQRELQRALDGMKSWHVIQARWTPTQARAA